MALQIDFLDGTKDVVEISGYLDANAAGPRFGRLSIRQTRYRTPNFFAVTSRGVVPHLTPDVLSALYTQIGGVSMALEGL